MVAFITAGYKILWRQDDCLPALPLRIYQLHPGYRRFSEDDLLIQGLDVVVQKV